jgi:hypothetical protein
MAQKNKKIKIAMMKHIKSEVARVGGCDWLLGCSLKEVKTEMDPLERCVGAFSLSKWNFDCGKIS